MQCMGIICLEVPCSGVVHPDTLLYLLRNGRRELVPTKCHGRLPKRRDLRRQLTDLVRQHAATHPAWAARTLAFTVPVLLRRAPPAHRYQCWRVPEPAAWPVHSTGTMAMEFTVPATGTLRLVDHFQVYYKVAVPAGGPWHLVPLEHVSARIVGRNIVCTVRPWQHGAPR